MVAQVTMPDSTEQVGVPYKANIDAVADALARLGLAFLPQAQSTPNMTVRVLAGQLFTNGALTAVAAQNTGTITAPVGNPRIDRVVLNLSSGAVEVVTGTPAGSPAAPAIPADRWPICQILLQTSTTAIGASMITDERAAPTGTAALRDVGTGATQIPTNADIVAATATITAGEDLADRDLIYQDMFNERGGGATKWYKVDADATSPVRISPRLGIALAAISSAATGTAQVRAGRVSGFSGLTAGVAVWASGTAGGVTQTDPAVPASGTQVAVRLIGIAASTTEIDFDPDDDTTFVTRNSALASTSTLTVQHFADTGAKQRIPHAYIAVDVFSSTASAALNADFNNSSTYAVRVVVPAADISISGSKIKITLAAASGEGLTFTTCRIQEKAASGNAWDFASAGVTVTFNGGADGGTISAGGTLTSDEITFAFDETKSYVVSFYISGAGSFDSARKLTTKAGWTAYTKIGSSADASGTTPSGFSDSADDVIGVSDILVNSGTRAEPVTIGSETVNSAATDRVTVQFSDSSSANETTHTTGINRTGATRDLIFEVTV